MIPVSHAMESAMRIACLVRLIISFPMEGVCMLVPMVLMPNLLPGHAMPVMEVVRFVSDLPSTTVQAVSLG